MVYVCNRGERMRKVLLIFLIVGVFMLGTFSIVVEECVNAVEAQDILRDRDSLHCGGESQEGSILCGGGGGGAGAPG
jgi:hypothetical protein